ncbi:MAG: GNAT family N-acetyltransferase [Alphaproteobacteria bacterium]
MGHIITLGTERLTLRPFSISDFNDLNEWLSLMEVRQYLNMDEGSEEAIRAWLELRLPHKEDMGISFMSWAISPKGSYKVIGSIELWGTGVGRPAGEVGFAMNPNYQRQGIIQEAMQLVLDHCFYIWKLPRVQAVIAVDNLPSIKLVEKMGFIREGVLRSQVQTQNYQGDAYIYSILPPEWQNNCFSS